MFEEFARFEEQDNLGVRGAGLGLAVAKRMAGLMGTHVRLRSELGLGSVFSVRVPRLAASKSRHWPSTRAAQTRDVSLSGLSVLCVDDEPIILEGMRALLERWNCVVHTAADLQAAEDTIAAEPIDAIIADYQLKQQRTGLDLLIEERQRLGHADRVALLTAEATGAVLQQAKQAGVRVMSKPADPQEIREFLMSCLDLEGAQAAE